MTAEAQEAPNTRPNTRRKAVKILKPAVQRSLRSSAVVLGAVLLWMVLGSLDLIHSRYVDTGIVVLGAVLFVLALPLSLLVRLDALQNVLTVESKGALLLLGVVLVFLNFTLWNVMRVLLRPPTTALVKPESKNPGAPRGARGGKVIRER